MWYGFKVINKKVPISKVDLEGPVFSVEHLYLALWKVY